MKIKLIMVIEGNRGCGYADAEIDDKLLAIIPEGKRTSFIAQELQSSMEAMVLEGSRMGQFNPPSESPR